MSDTVKVGSELDPSESSMEEAKKLKLMEEISQMKNVVNIAKQTLDETKKSLEEEKEETVKKLESKEEEEMKKYQQELRKMKEMVLKLKEKKEGKKMNEKDRTQEPRSASKKETSDSVIVIEEEDEEDDQSPPNPPLNRNAPTPKFSIFNPFTWFANPDNGRYSKRGRNTRSRSSISPSTNSESPQEKKKKKSLTESISPPRKKTSLFESVGGVSNTLRAYFENSDSIQDLMLDQVPYSEWKKNDIHIWLNKIGMYSVLFVNFTKLEIGDHREMEISLRENHQTFFEGLEKLEQMKFIMYLFYSKFDGKYFSYHNVVIEKLSQFTDFLRIDPEILFQQFCVNLTDRKSIETLLEDLINNNQSALPNSLPSQQPDGTSVPSTRMEMKVALMPSPLYTSELLLRNEISGSFSASDMKCPMIETPLTVGLLVGTKTLIQWCPCGFVLIKRLDGLEDCQLVELARLELPSVHDFPMSKIVDVVVTWNTEKQYTETGSNAVHFIDRVLEAVVGEMSSNLELLSVRYRDGASNEILEPIRANGTLSVLPLEGKPIKSWSTLDLLTFYFTLGISRYFTTEFEFDLDGCSLFEADETLLQVNLLDSPRMSFLERIQFLVFHRVLICLNGYDMRFRRGDIVVYRKFVASSYKRLRSGTSQKFHEMEVYEVDEKGWLGGVGIVNMNMTNVVPYLCSPERFESKFFSRLPLSETKIQIICLLEDHQYPIITPPQQQQSSSSQILSKNNNNNSDEKKYGGNNNKKNPKLEEETEGEKEEDEKEKYWKNHMKTVVREYYGLETEEGFERLLKFRSAVLINRNMMVDWTSQHLIVPRSRFYRSDPRGFELYDVPEKKDLSHPDMKKKICTLLVDYCTSKLYDCGYQKKKNADDDVDDDTPKLYNEKKTRREKNSQQFLDDFFKVCGWKIFGGEQQEEEEEVDTYYVRRVVEQIRKYGYGIPIFEPTDAFVSKFGIDNNSYFGRYVVKTKEEELEKKQYRIIFKTHEELDSVAIELMKKNNDEDGISFSKTPEYRLLKLYDRLFWHQYVCHERKGVHLHQYSVAIPKTVNNSSSKKKGGGGGGLPSFGRLLHGMSGGGGSKSNSSNGSGSSSPGGAIKPECLLCPFGNPYQITPKNAFKKR